MAIVIDGNNTPTAGGVGYGDGTELAFTAAGTSGQPVVSGGASAPVFRPYTLPAADGSASQVLQTNGSGALSFATPSAGALTFLSSVSASASATVDLETTFNSTYDVYMIVASQVILASDDQKLTVRMKLSGSYATTNYQFSLNGTSPAAANNTFANRTSTGESVSNAIWVAAACGNVTDESHNVVIYVYGPTSTSLRKMISWTGVNIDSNGNSVNAQGVGSNTGTGALTGIRFLSSSGNISSGSFRLYGIANS
jgi:hypothetical protein